MVLLGTECPELMARSIKLTKINDRFVIKIISQRYVMISWFLGICFSLVSEGYNFQSK
jgi:hypothetical protein